MSQTVTGAIFILLVLIGAVLGFANVTLEPTNPPGVFNGTGTADGIPDWQ